MAYFFLIHRVTVIVSSISSDSKFIVVATFLEVTISIKQEFWYPFWQSVTVEINLVTDAKRVSAVALRMSMNTYGDNLMPKLV